MEIRRRAFDAAKEVFDVMAVAIVSAVEAGGLPATAFRRNATASALGAQPAAEVVGVKALVRHDEAVPSPREHGLDGQQVMAGAGRQRHGKGATVPIHDGRQFGVQPAFGPSHRLGQLATCGVGSMLMQFDVRAVQMPQHTAPTPAQHAEHPGEQAACAPTPEPGVDCSPGPKVRRHIAPGQPCAQDVDDATEHQSVILGRTTTHCAIRPTASSCPAQVNFLSRRQSGSARSIRLGRSMRSHLIAPSLLCSDGFENTP